MYKRAQVSTLVLKQNKITNVKHIHFVRAIQLRAIILYVYVSRLVIEGFHVLIIVESSGTNYKIHIVSQEGN